MRHNLVDKSKELHTTSWIELSPRACSVDPVDPEPVDPVAPEPVDPVAPERVTPYVAKKDQDGDDDAGGLSTGAIAAIGASVGFVAVGAVLFILTATTNKAGPIHEEQAGDQFNEDSSA